MEFFTLLHAGDGKVVRSPEVRRDESAVDGAAARAGRRAGEDSEKSAAAGVGRFGVGEPDFRPLSQFRRAGGRVTHGAGPARTGRFAIPCGWMGSAGKKSAKAFSPDSSFRPLSSI